MSVSQKESAARRVGLGLFSMNGRRHAHYRELISQPLRRSNIDPGSGEMAVLADAFRWMKWPVGRPVPTCGGMRGTWCAIFRWGCSSAMTGSTRHPIADLVDKRVLFKWTLGAQVCPFNMPADALWKDDAPVRRKSSGGSQEWAGCKRGAALTTAT